LELLGGFGSRREQEAHPLRVGNKTDQYEFSQRKQNSQEGVEADNLTIEAPTLSSVSRVWLAKDSQRRQGIVC